MWLKRLWHSGENTDLKKKLYTYDKFIYELSESREAALLRQRVWVVSKLVHDTAGLQGAGTVKEGGGQLL